MKLILLAFLAAALAAYVQAAQTNVIQAEFKYLDIPTFIAGERGPLLGRVVLRLSADKTDPVTASAALVLTEGGARFEGKPCQVYPGIFSALDFPVELADPPAKDEVVYATLEVRIGDGVVLKRPVWIYVRRSGFFYRTYRSRLDDTVYPYALYLPPGYDSPERKWPLVLSLHGAYSNHGNNMKRLFGIPTQEGEPDEFAFFSLPVRPVLPEVPGIVVSPWGRGTMGYHGPGARDVLDVLEIVTGAYPVDPEKISVTGLSMGGNGTWEMALRKPDLFATAAPVCPPADMNVDRIASGRLAVLHERFDWVDRIVAQNQISNWAVNASATKVHIYHGNDDPTVPIANSEKMVEALGKFGIEAPLTRFDNVGHNAWDPAYEGRRVLLELLSARRPLPQKLVRFTTCRYADSRHGWLEIVRFTRYGDYALVTAAWDPAKGEIEVRELTNVSLLKIHPDRLAAPGSLKRLKLKIIDGGSAEAQVTDGGPLPFRIGKNGKVSLAAGRDLPSGPVKRKGLEGPVWEALADRVVLVYGSGGGGGETLKQLLRFVNWGELPDVHFIIKRDTEVTDEDLRESHLVLFGDERSNSLIARINSRSPISFAGNDIIAGGKRFGRDEVSFKCVFPNPLNPDRLVFLDYHEEWDYAHRWGFQGVMKMVPDYLVYRRGSTEPFGGEVLLGGFFDENWNW
ncbi:MAG: prolyl oligopeptidase family serine peptidase [Candidatus Glassbacteria bacterium]